MNIVKNSNKISTLINLETIQMLYHVTAATEKHMYTMLILCTCTSSYDIDRIFINFMDT